MKTTIGYVASLELICEALERRLERLPNDTWALHKLDQITAELRDVEVN